MKKGKKEGDADGETHTEGMSGEGEGLGRLRLAVEGTGTPDRERRRGQAVRGDRGRWAAGVARVETKKKKKKKGRRPKDLFGRRPEGRRGFIPVAPARARPRDLDVNQVDNVTSPPRDVRRGGFRRLEGGGKWRGRCPDGAGRWRRCSGRALVACRPSGARNGS